MLFNSFTFLIFFAILLVLNRMPIPWRGRKIILLVASYLFYAAWNAPFVLLLVVSTLADWFIARALHRAESKSRRNLLMFASVAVNMGLLGFFKYGTFVSENVIALVNATGIPWEAAPPRCSSR